MDNVAAYLLSEKLLGLTAGLIGASSMLVGVFILTLLPHYKGFAVAMLLLGALEAGIFIIGYYKADDKIQAQAEIYQQDPATYLSSQVDLSQKALRSFFRLKLLYAIGILLLVVIVSKTNLSPFYHGVLTAVIVHLAMAITIDSVGEQYTRKFHAELTHMSR